MYDNKRWWQSKTVWGGGVAMASGIVGLFGYNVVGADQAQIVEIGSGISVIAASILAIFGRLKASKTVGKK